MYIIIAIIAFGLLIAVHEFGHFSAAKLLGIKVNEFSIGMGPAILKRQRGETFYALRCLPIGGYCAMEGEDEETDDPRAFTRQPGWKRLIVLCAGSFMNFILGFLLVLVVYVQAAGFYSPVIDSFAEGCPYEGGQALMAGDEIYSVDGHRTWFMGNVSTFLSRGDGVYDIVVIRDGEKVELKDFKLVPVEYEGGMSYGWCSPWSRPPSAACSRTPGTRRWTACASCGSRSPTWWPGPWASTSSPAWWASSI